MAQPKIKNKKSFSDIKNIEVVKNLMTTDLRPSRYT